MYQIGHLGYVVKNIEKSISQFENEGAKLILSPVEDRIQRVMVSLLETDANICIELVAPIKDCKSPVESRLKRGGGLDHICYIVDSMEEAMNKEIRQRAHLLHAPSYAKAFNANVAFFFRSSGLLVELMEYV
ncbi:MAG: VOC family protein [Gammaproteobacteria bacterium]